MFISNLKWVVSVYSTNELEGFSLGKLKRYFQLILFAFMHKNLISTFRYPDPDTSLKRLMSERPEIIGTIIWPYQCSKWKPEERLNKIINHCKIIDKLGMPLTISLEKRLILLDLDEMKSGLKIVIDHPKWFMREGLLSINIFINNFRVYTLAFSFQLAKDDKLDCFIGAIKGRKIENNLQIYKELTKILYGIRPRDFLIELLRIFCRYYDINNIFAVSDKYRHHRHSYFNKKKLILNYDHIWNDRGGIKVDETFYKLAVSPVRKDISEIKSKKKSMYKKRYDFIDKIESKIISDVPNMEPVFFKDL